MTKNLDSCNITLVLFLTKRLLLDSSRMQKISMISKNKSINFLDAITKKYMCIYNMVIKFIVPPAGLPNQGLRKKLNAKHWLSTRKNLLRQEVFFLWAARSNWGYLENAAVS